jgi:K+-transporting ATPase ATPase A chain
MLAGRFLMIIPMLAIAGNLARKRYVPPSLGTFPVTTPLFTVLLIGAIRLLGAYIFPALSWARSEHLMLGVRCSGILWQRDQERFGTGRS